MHWETEELGLPKLSPRRRWSLLIDTSLEDPFISGECVTDDQHVVEVAPRSIRILGTVTSDKPVRRRKNRAKRSADKPAAAGHTGKAGIAAASFDEKSDAAPSDAAGNTSHGTEAAGAAQGKEKTDEKE